MLNGRPTQRFPRCAALALAAVAILGGVGCPTAPKPTPTILISNDTCEPGPCRSLYIRAFIWDFKVPQPPTGLEILGYMHGSYGCLSFPSKWTLELDGPSDTTELTWTPTSPAGIYLIFEDSAFIFGPNSQAQIDSATNGIWPYDAAFPGSVAFSPTFVPGSARGWSITVPATNSIGGPTPGLKPTTACPSPQQPAPETK
jgi:hypothetical protein